MDLRGLKPTATISSRYAAKTKKSGTYFGSGCYMRTALFFRASRRCQREAVEVQSVQDLVVVVARGGRRPVGELRRVSAFEDQDRRVWRCELRMQTRVVEGVVLVTQHFHGGPQGPVGVSASAYHNSPNADGLPKDCMNTVTQRFRHAFQAIDPLCGLTGEPSCAAGMLS